MKIQRGRHVRILTLDVRGHKCGYALFENSVRLLDCGYRGFKTPFQAASRVTALLRIFKPAMLILRSTSQMSKRRSRRLTSVMRSVCRAARSSSVDIGWIHESQLRRVFTEWQASNKDRRVAILSERYPQLASRVPPPRKRWQNEHWYMTVFDAVALGVVYITLTEQTASQHSRSA